jgi:hypothetical protein
MLAPRLSSWRAQGERACKSNGAARVAPEKPERTSGLPRPLQCAGKRKCGAIMPERFWREKNDRWPSDWPGEYVFLLSAFEQAGKVTCGDAWKGSEGYVVAKGFVSYSDFIIGVRRENPDLSVDEQRAMARRKADETNVMLSEYMARAKKVHRAIAVACASGAIPSFTLLPSTGEMYDVKPDRWRTDNLKPRFLKGQITPSDIASSAFAGQGFYPVFLAERPFKEWLVSLGGGAVESAPLPPVAPVGGSAIASAAHQKNSPPPKKTSKPDVIHSKIALVYEEAKRQGVKPPNVNEVAPFVNTLLGREDRCATVELIRELAGDARYTPFKLPLGRHAADLRPLSELSLP